jgi:hypothetical protein
MFRANLSAHESFLVERNVSHRRNRRWGLPVTRCRTGRLWRQPSKKQWPSSWGERTALTLGLPLLLLLSKEGGEGNENGLRGHARLLKP